MKCKILFDVEIYFHWYPEQLMCNTTADPLFNIPKGIHFVAAPVAIYTLEFQFQYIFLYPLYQAFTTPFIGYFSYTL